jgi:glycosyltransferase involved in cell wall biosynthesis
MEQAVLASDLKPFRELVSDGVTGCLFTAGEPTDLAEKAIHLLGNPELRRQYGKAGRYWVERDRRWSDSVSRYDGVYASVLS